MVETPPPASVCPRCLKAQALCVCAKIEPLDNKIATIAFTYKQNLEMDDQSRVENPLGFWVTSYRVDDDYATAPPPEVSVSPATTQPAPAMAAASAPAAAPPAAAATDTLPGAGPR